MRGCEADSHHTRNLGNSIKKFRETSIAVPVGVHILTKKCNLYKTVIHRLPDLFHNTLHRTAPLSPPGEGDDAECTELVTSPHDGDPRIDSFLAGRIEVFIHFKPRETRVNNGSTGLFMAAKKFRYPAV